MDGGVAPSRCTTVVTSGAVYSTLTSCTMRPNSIFFLPTKHVRDVKTKYFVTRVRRASGIACQVCSFGHGSGGNGAHRLRARLSGSTVSCSMRRSCHARCAPGRGRSIRLIAYPCFAASICSLARGVAVSCDRLSSFMVCVYVRNAYAMASKSNGSLRLRTNRSVLFPTAAGRIGIAIRNRIGFLRACMWEFILFLVGWATISGACGRDDDLFCWGRYSLFGEWASNVRIC